MRWERDKRGHIEIEVGQDGKEGIVNERTKRRGDGKARKGRESKGRSDGGRGGKRGRVGKEMGQYRKRVRKGRWDGKRTGTASTKRGRRMRKISKLKRKTGRERVNEITG